MHAVMAQSWIPAPVEHVWKVLSDKEMIARWFADTLSFRPGEKFRFEFGDGDFLEGQITQWSPPHVLELRWKLMGIGPEYEICFSLLPRRDGTELSIQDKGALTLDMALCLRVGWTELLFRIEKAIRQDRNTRFDWRREIFMTATLNGHKSQIQKALSDTEWYRQALAGTVATVAQSSSEGMTAIVGNEAWGNVETQLDFQFRQIDQTDYLFLAHRGWPELPAECAANQRRRFAELWVNALSELGVE